MQFDSNAPASASVEHPSGPFIHPGYVAGFAVVTSLFLLWAVGNNLNDILIRQFQKALALDRAEAGMIQLVYYFGYFVIALPAGFLVQRFGYRTGILAGLGLYATGALLFYPAAEIRVFGVFLGALFVIAAGSAILETVANPFVTAFGDPSRASQRLNFAQAFNGVGSILAPIVGGLFIFSGIEHSHADLSAMSAGQRDAYRMAEAQAVQLPYLALASVVALVGIAALFVRLPSLAEPAPGDDAPRTGLRALLRLPSLTSAVVAQFFYIGAQVSIWSFFIDFVKDVAPATPERLAAYGLSASFFLFTAGRFVGAAMMSRISAVKMLIFAGIANIALCLIAMLLPGIAAAYALGLTSLFGSIIFPTIFALGVRDLGGRASLGPSLLIMAIVGGAILPPLMGLLSQSTDGGIRLSLIVPIVSFVIITRFAIRQHRAA